MTPLDQAQSMIAAAAKASEERRGRPKAVNLRLVEKVKTDDVKFYNTAFNIVRDNLFFAEYLKSL